MAAEWIQDRPTIRLLIADGRSLFRQAFRAALEGEPHLEVVGEAGDGLQAVAEAERVRPDLALLFSDMPNCSGIQAAAMITERLPECKVAIISDEEDEDTLLEALEAGATGFLTKESPLQDLIEAVSAIYRGETLIPRNMLGRLLATLIRKRREHDEALMKMSKLSQREQQVLALLAKGRDNDGISQALVISPQTARTHIQNVLTKLDVHSRLDAAKFVMRNGILDMLARNA
ncbi:MAG: response regulator transcription factor [Actinomycetota bacterium]